MHINTIGEALEFFSILNLFFPNFQMISALHQNLRYLRYISAILSAACRITAKLNEIVQ